MISIFRIGRSVMKTLSSLRSVNILIHCNSDVFTTCDQDQDHEQPAAVRRCLEFQVTNPIIYNREQRRRRPTNTVASSSASSACPAVPAPMGAAPVVTAADELAKVEAKHGKAITLRMIAWQRKIEADTALVDAKRALAGVKTEAKQTRDTWGTM
jgi:predicted dienelactone hydrolase